MKICGCHSIFSAVSKTNDHGSVQCLKMQKKLLGLLGILTVGQVTGNKKFFRCFKCLYFFTYQNHMVERCHDNVNALVGPIGV